MPFDDFLHQFSELAICRVINTSLFSFSKTWTEKQMTGDWSASDNRAGGCLNHPETFLHNPQYRFDVAKEDDTVIIQVLNSHNLPQIHLVFVYSSPSGKIQTSFILGP